MSCSATDFEPCLTTSLPSNFCCPSSTFCLELASNSTVICCPNGGDCTVIEPITCDITLQNTTLYPNNTAKTTNLTGVMESCGTGCCPFGSTCDGNKSCNMDTGFRVLDFVNSSSSTTESSTTTSTSTPSQSSTILATSTTPTAVPSSVPSSSPASTAKPAPVISITISIIVALLLAGLLFWYWRRRKSNPKPPQERWDNAELSADEIKRRLTVRYELYSKALAEEFPAEDVSAQRFELPAKALTPVPYVECEAVELPATPVRAERGFSRGGMF